MPVAPGPEHPARTVPPTPGGQEEVIMGKVSGNWITGMHSGRACRHDDVYTKVDRKTGACYSVRLCNPNTNWTERQQQQRASFASISSAICAWIKEGKEKNSADYLKVKKIYDRQRRYSTLRGMMFSRGMYVVDEDGSVTIDINAGTMGGSASGGSANPGGGSTNPGGGSDEEEPTV